MLCSQCNAMFTNPVFSGYTSLPHSLNEIRRYYGVVGTKVHHENWDSLRAALEAGCELCHRLVEALSSARTNAGVVKLGQPGPNIDASTFSTTFRLAFETANRSLISLYYVAQAKQEDKTLYQKHTEYLFRANDQSPIPEQYEPSNELDLDSSAIDVLVGWISNCRKNHKSCGQRVNNAPSSRFARIVDVGKSGDSSSDHHVLRVCPLSEMDAGAEYMTLSHRWAGASIPTLTTVNYAEYTHSMVLDALPQVFRDAIRLCRRLSVQYIWIDSLCIVQDNPQEWLEQAILMGEIYQGSCLNISATSTDGPHGSLFVQRDGLAIKEMRVGIKGIKGETDQVSWYEVGTDCNMHWYKQIRLSELSKRGWVVQERLLSPRVVHFANKQIFWECLEARCCEGSPHVVLDATTPSATTILMDFKTWDPYSENLVTHPARKQVTEHYKRSAVQAMSQMAVANATSLPPEATANQYERNEYMAFGDLEWEPTHPLLLYWAKIIRAYSSTSLSFIDDRLIAISGLARILSERTGISYLAGIWHYQLPRQLLWGFLGAKPTHSEHYIAPSWSWASQTGAVELYGLEFDPKVEEEGGIDIIKVLSVDIEGSSTQEPSFGQVKGGRLRIRGRLLPIGLDHTKWPHGEYRKEMLVQFWQGTTQQFPLGETFLVPVLFTCLDRHTVSVVSNCLIIEATEEQGVFRHVGKASLSSHCSLTGVTAQLYMATVPSQGAVETIAGVQGQAATSEDAAPATTQSKVRSPQEELYEARRQMMGSGVTEDAMDSMKKSEAKVERQANGMQAIQSTLSLAASQIRTKAAMRGELPSRQLPAASGPAKVEHRQAQRMSPEQAVARHFYKEYVEDGEVVRYGHFVFEII